MKVKKNRVIFLMTTITAFLLVLSASFPLQAVEADYLKALKWRSIGPHRGGRVVAVAGHPTKKDVFYFGGTGSGVWKTIDGGDTWKNVSDGFFKTSSVGAIAVSASNPNVIYTGMGEACLRGNISHGDGVYKSIDGGKTWKHMGLTDTRHIGRLLIHPQNADIVYVAALGHAFGPNKERGVFRTTDGGKTWKNILFRSEKSGAIDMVLEPGNPNVIYTAFWQVQRFPWGFESGGKDSALYKSIDGGETWTDISANPGLPTGIKGRIGLTISKAKPERVWAIVEAKKSGLYRSEDSGATWKLASDKADLLQRPWYYSHVKADPQNPDLIYVMNVRFWKSTDNGKTWKMIRVPHSDNHDLWIDPEDPMRMIEGNDGGATVSFNGGRTWSSIMNQPTAQFYHVTTDNRYPYRVYGAQQDNSTLSVPSRSRRGRITEREWYSVGGCESGYITVHPGNPDIIYAGCYGGSLTRYDHKLQSYYDISVWPEDPMGSGAIDLKYRFQWTFPILFSPHDPNVLYVSANHVFRSTTEGRSWDEISPDLTRNDKSKMGSSGGPLTKDNTSVEYYGTIFALAESPVEKGVLWAGSDDGLIHISRDNGKSWQNITPKSKMLPEWTLISIIEPSQFDAGTAYVAATRYKLDDYQPYLYVTADYGKTWKKITTGIPANAFTRVIREDPNRKGILYAGTETGIYFSTDSGKKWKSLQLNLPVTPIHDLVIHNNDIVVGTHGRSFWILDDLTLLYQSLEMKPDETHFLFKPAKTILFNGYYIPKPKNAGETLPVGVIVNYYFKDKPNEKEAVTISFLDSKGETIRTFVQKPKKKREPKVPAKKGMNRFTWNFNYESSSTVEGAVFWGPRSVAPFAIPGNYKVKLTVGETVLEQDFEIVKDPGQPITQEDFQRQFDLLTKIRDKVTMTHDTVNEIRSLRKQLDWWKNRTKDKPYFEKIKKAAKAIKDKMEPVEDALIQKNAKAMQDLLNVPIRLNNKLINLGSGVVEFAPGPPPRQAYAVYDSLSKRVDIQLDNFKKIMETEVAAFNKLIKQLEVPALLPKHMK